MKTSTKPVDRRIQRTQKILTDALVSLIIEKGYDEVTIQEIIDRANVGRSTFYAHYESKEQLLLSGRHQLNDVLLKRTEEGFDFLSLYRHAAENHKIAKAMMGYKGGELIMEHIREELLQAMKQHMKGKPKGNAKQQMMAAYTCEVVAVALVRLLFCWIRDEMPFTPEEMATKSKEVTDALLYDRP